MTDYRATFRGTPASVRDARKAIVDYARLCGFRDPAAYDIALAAGEALANAVEHGNKDLGYIGVHCTFEEGELTIEIRDAGRGFDPSEIVRRNAQPDATRGFGLTIMHAIMDGVEYRRRGTLVRLRKRHRLASAAEPREA